jgi:murein DD-endopeptidase MepM/ murein hydrolase activator NlpD
MYGNPWKRSARTRVHDAVKRRARYAVLACIVCLFPSAHTFDREVKPYYGDFAWSAVQGSRLSPGGFAEPGRGGVEHDVPKLRLIEHRVGKGDTLWTIAKRFDVEPDGVISSNSFSNVHRIREGDVVLVPNMRGIFVDVGKGDTLLGFASRHRVSPGFIMEVNDLQSGVIEPGMRIFLPGARFSSVERAYALGVAFEKPVRGRVTSRFGYRRDPFSRKRAYHTGIDIGIRAGAEVHAAREGTVAFSGARFGSGKVVILMHGFGYQTVYAHLSATRVSRGQKVRKGEIVGFVGDSGRSTGPHLHFEIWRRGKLVNPLALTDMSVR